MNPNPDSALNEAAGKLFLEDYELFARRAALMAQIHAGAPNRSDPNSNPNVNANLNPKESPASRENRQLVSRIELSIAGVQDDLQSIIANPPPKRKRRL